MCSSGVMRWPLLRLPALTKLDTRQLRVGKPRPPGTLLVRGSIPSSCSRQDSTLGGIVLSLCPPPYVLHPGPVARLKSSFTSLWKMRHQGGGPCLFFACRRGYISRGGSSAGPFVSVLFRVTVKNLFLSPIRWSREGIVEGLC